MRVQRRGQRGNERSKVLYRLKEAEAADHQGSWERGHEGL